MEKTKQQTTIQVRFFGRAEIEFPHHGVSMPLTGNGALLFAFIAQYPEPYDKSKLASKFYSTSNDPRNSLSKLLNRFNTSFPEPLLSYSQHKVWVNPELSIWIDVHQFEQMLSKSEVDWLGANQYDLRHIEGVMRLYRGKFLGEIRGLDDPVERWLVAQRHTLHQQYGTWLERLARLYLVREMWQMAEHVVDRGLAIDPLHEKWCQLKIIALVAQGEKKNALRVAQTYTQRLKRELNTMPSALFQSRIEKIKQIEQRKNAPTPQLNHIEHSLQVHHIPRPVGPIFGREAQLKRLVTTLMGDDIQLLSLVGWGGVGKTVLAREIGYRLQHLFQHGVCLISFKSLPETADAEMAKRQIITIICNQLQIDEEDDQNVGENLFTLIQNYELLLVLDHIDAVLSGYTILVDLLSNAPHLQIITTSRLVPPHQMFENMVVASILGLDEPDAIHQFIQCAKRHLPTFSIQNQPYDEKEIAQICQLVGGVPLAINLATNWLHTYSLAQIIKQLKQDTHFLEGTQSLSTDIEQKQLVIIIEKTWIVLSIEAQAYAGKLSIFAYRFGADAAEQITKCSFAFIQYLLAHGILLTHAPDSYQLHPLIHSLAVTKLATNKQWKTTTEHAYYDYYKRLMHQYAHNQDDHSLLETVKIQTADLKKGLRKILISTDYTDEEKQKYLFEVTSCFCQIGRGDELKRLFDKMKENLPTSPFIQASFYLAMSHLITILDHDGLTIPYLETANQLLLCKNEEKDFDLRVSTLCQLSLLHKRYGRFDQMQRYRQEVQKIEETYPLSLQRQGRIESVYGLVDLFNGNLDQAEIHLKNSLKLMQKVDNGREQSLAWGNLGQLFIQRESFVQAETCIRKGLKIAENIQDESRIQNLSQYQTDLDLNWGRFHYASTSDTIWQPLQERAQQLSGLDHQVREIVIQYECGRIDVAWELLQQFQEQIVLSEEDTTYATLQCHALKAGLFDNLSHTERVAYLNSALQNVLQLGNTPIAILPLCAAVMLGKPFLLTKLWECITQLISTEASAFPYLRTWVRRLNREVISLPITQHSYQKEVKPLIQQCLLATV